MTERQLTPAEREQVENFRQFLENHPDLEGDEPRAVHEFARHLHDPADAGGAYERLTALLLPVWEQYRTDRSIL